MDPFRPILLVEYGNRSGHDIDVFALFENGPFIITEIGLLDYISINQRRFHELLNLYDPLVIEPILTGVLFGGNEEALILYKRQISNLKVSNDMIEHLFRRSIEELSNSYIFLHDYESTNNSFYLRSALVDLSFSCSYR